MPDIVFRSSSGVFSVLAALTVPKPAGTSVNDLLIAEIESIGTVDGIVTVPVGWTLLPLTNLVDTASSHWIYWKMATGTEPTSYVWTFNDPRPDYSALMLCFENVDGVHPTDVYTANGVTFDGIPTALGLHPNLLNDLSLVIFGRIWTQQFNGFLAKDTQFRAATVRANVFATTTATVTKPAGTADGDLIIVQGLISGGNLQINVPAGWTRLAGSGNLNNQVFWKIASGEPASWVFTWNGAPHTNLFTAFSIYSVAGRALAVTGTLSYVASDTHKVADVITPAQNALILVDWIQDTGGEIPSLPAGLIGVTPGDNSSVGQQAGYTYGLAGVPTGSYDSIGPGGSDWGSGTFAIISTPPDNNYVEVPTIVSNQGRSQVAFYGPLNSCSPIPNLVLYNNPSSATFPGWAAYQLLLRNQDATPCGGPPPPPPPPPPGLCDAIT
jgi:hypothetical protein